MCLALETVENVDKHTGAATLSLSPPTATAANKTTQVWEIRASQYAFAAILQDGSVVAWGDCNNGGDCSLVQSQLKHVKDIQAPSVGSAECSQVAYNILTRSLCRQYCFNERGRGDTALPFALNDRRSVEPYHPTHCLLHIWRLPRVLLQL